VNKKYLELLVGTMSLSPTFYSILEIYRSQGIIFESDKVFNPHLRYFDLPNTSTVLLIDKYIEFFSLLILQDSQFININPYLTTCAVIAAARKSAGLQNIWADELV